MKRLCACGCGKEVRNMYVRGHNSRVKLNNKHVVAKNNEFKENDFWYLLGLAIGDGCVRSRHAITIACSEEEFAERINGMFKNSKSKVYPHNGAYYAGGSSRKIAELIRDKDEEISVPHEYMNEFAAGLFDADGCVNNNHPRNTLNFEQKREWIADLFMDCLIQQGIDARKGRYKDKRYNEYYMNKIYVNGVSEFIKFYEVIPLRSEKKKQLKIMIDGYEDTRNKKDGVMKSRIISLISDKPSTIRNMADKFKRTYSTISEHIMHLKKSGKIESVGKQRPYRWRCCQ